VCLSAWVQRVQVCRYRVDATKSRNRVAQSHRSPTYDTARVALQRLVADVGDRRLTRISRHEAIEWADRVPPSRVPVAVTCMNAALDEELIERNPLRALSAPSRAGPTAHREPVLVFRAKRGGQLSRPTLSGYWGKVCAAPGLNFDFYLATKHWCVHHLFCEVGPHHGPLPSRLGGAWPERSSCWPCTGTAMWVALEELDRAVGANVTPLRVASRAV
jgi:hypothetical protein